MNVNGSKWEYMKVYEALRWYMNAYEGIWMYMSQYDGCVKVYDSIWIKMVRNEFIWKCMKLCDGLGIYMIVYGCISALMDVYENI